MSKAMALTPTRASCYNNRAQIHRFNSNISAALQDLNKAIQISHGRGRSACQAFCQRGMYIHKSLLVKNNYYESSTLNAKKGPMKTAAQNRSANSDGSVIARGPTFSLVNALVYVEHRPGHSLGKK